MDKKKRQAIKKGLEKVKGKVEKASLKGGPVAGKEVAAAAAAKEPKVQRVAKSTKSGMAGLPRLPSKAKKRSPRPTHPCACGCETPTKGQWAPGHDARAKGWALRVHRGVIGMGDVPANERVGAKLMLARLTGEAPAPAPKVRKMKLAPKPEQQEVEQAEQPTQEPVTEPVTVTAEEAAAQVAPQSVAS